MKTLIVCILLAQCPPVLAQNEVSFTQKKAEPPKESNFYHKGMDGQTISVKGYVVDEPRSSTAEGSGFGRKILASANPIPASRPSQRPMRNDRRITATQGSSLDAAPGMLSS